MNDVQRRALESKIKEMGRCEIERGLEELPNRLKSTLDDCFLTILGLKKDKWSGVVEVDRCNGREPLISELVKNRVKSDAVAWVQKVSFPELTKKEIDALKKDYRRERNQYIQDRLQDIARDDAKTYIDQILSESVTDFVLDIEGDA